MSRLTRAQRRKIEEVIHEKIDLDNLSTFDLDEQVSAHTEDTTNSRSPKVIRESAEDHPEKVFIDTTFNTKSSYVKSHQNSSIDNQQSEKVTITTSTTNTVSVTTTSREVGGIDNNDRSVEDESSSDSSSEDESSSDSSSEEEDSASDSSEESDDESDADLDSLLMKAQENLESKKKLSGMITLSESKVNKKLPKLEAHLSKDSLYIDDTRKQAKLSEKSIAMVASGEKIPKNVPLVVVANKDEEKSRMSQKQRQEERARTSGKGWFDMPKPEMTDELKRDLQVLKMRHVLDRKRHYKKMGKKADPTYFQVGTIIESPTEFFSARMTRKERKGTIVDELLANEESKQYYKRKFNETQEKKRSGGKKDFKKLKAQRR